ESGSSPSSPSATDPSSSAASPAGPAAPPAESTLPARSRSAVTWPALAHPASWFYAALPFAVWPSRRARVGEYAPPVRFRPPSSSNTAGLQSDLRSRRQFLQELPE